MKTKLIKYITLIIFSTQISCYNEFIIDVEPGENKMVVNGLINNKDTLSVTVTKSFSPKGEVQVNELESAIVSIYENDSFIENMQYIKSETDPVGKFVAGFIPASGNKYTIEVNDNQMGQSLATTKLPEPVNISGFTAYLTEWGKNGWNKPKRYRFNFILHDPEPENYYFLRIYMKIYHKDTGIDSSKVLTYMNGEVISSSMADQMKYVYGGILFTDEAFNGTDHSISGTATLQDTSLVVNSLSGVDVEAEDVIMDISKLYLQLESLSKETYLFYKSHSKVIRIAKYSSNINYKELPPVYGNIENGLGIFGGLCKKEVFMELN